MTRSIIQLAVIALTSASVTIPAFGAPVALETDFEQKPPAWFVSRFPAVEIREGSLAMTRVKGHASSVGVPLQANDAQVIHRFRLGEDGAFSLRFEHGYNLHLCRVLITPAGAVLRVDQPAGVSEGAEPLILAKSTTSIPTGEWLDLEFSAKGDRIEARIGDVILAGQHPILAKPKTSVIWALTQGSLAIDDLCITTPEGQLATKPAFSGGPRPIPIVTSATAERAASKDGLNPKRALGLFHDYVEPVLKKYCYECHSHDAKKAKGGLVVDSLNPMLKGGDLGPAIVPGDAKGSLLMEALLYENHDLQMPPDAKLDDTDIAHIREWIELGAAHPRTGPEIAESASSGPNAKELWSVQPLATVPVPETAGDWALTDSDRFIMAALDEAALAPSPDTPPHILLRRLHEVLTGLPPTEGETRRFIEAAETDLNEAMKSTVDALLASARFGERWGRHWLDVARYTDVTGSTNPKPMEQAWRFRDYVVHSFNTDKPWDEFVREQIAGDLLPAQTPVAKAENLIGTGYLALAHVLAVDRDKERLKLDTIDEQLDVIGKTFLGVQIGCARCHDHKIDPFPTRDYYAMAGLFRSTETLKSSDSQESIVSEGAELAAREGVPAWLVGGKGVRLHSASEADQIRNEPIHLRGEPSMLGDVVPRGFPSLVSVEGDLAIPTRQSGRRQLAEWLLHEDNVLASRVIVNRIWHHVFGQGLVRSTDNFGFTGDPPSHPELLDHLAIEFRTKHGFQFKSLIRELVLSRAFRQSSSIREEAMDIDPENRLLWRGNLRRRDAESLVDAIRWVAGSLDLRGAQSTVPPFEGGNQTSTADLSIPSTTLRKRALYWPVFRKDVPIDLDILALFDFPPATSPRGTRAVTQVPSQSLALLNSPMVLDSARALARHLGELPEAVRLEKLYLRLFARPIRDDEAAQLTVFLDQFTASLLATQSAKPANARSVAWNRLCHTLLASNEFLVIE